MNLDYIKLGDCLELMQEIPDKSIDLILCDLPYGTTACGWDVVIPFEPLWQHYNRIIKDNGAVVLFGNEPFSSKLRLSNLKNFKYDWIWKKPKGSGHLNAKKQPLRDYEVISVFYKKQCLYNPVFTKGTPYSRFKAGKNKSIQKGARVYGAHLAGAEIASDNSGFRYPKRVIEFGSVGARKTIHQAQKPVALLEYLIKTYTDPGDVVLDNCMGSGSTCVAAINTGRHYIGYEKEQKYFDIANKRIESAKEAHQ